MHSKVRNTYVYYTFLLLLSTCRLQHGRIWRAIEKLNSQVYSFRENSGNSELKRHLERLQERVYASIDSSKQKYYHRIANKLNNTQKNIKSYWS